VERLKKRSDIAGLVELVSGDDLSTQAAAASALKGMRDPRTVDVLLAALRNQELSATGKRRCAYLLGDLGDSRALDGLIVALRDPEREARAVAAAGLGRLGDRLAVDELIAALRDPEFSVRREAADALGKLGDTKAVLVLAAWTDHPHQPRDTAVFALQQLGKPAIDVLREAAGGRDPAARMNALYALAELGDEWAFEQLIAAVRDGSDEAQTRASTAEFLARRRKLGIGGPVEVRRRLPADIRDRIGEALAAFRTERTAIPYLIYEFNTATLVEEIVEFGEALAKFGAESVEPLLTALGDEAKLQRYREIAPMSDHEAGLLIVELTGDRIKHIEALTERAQRG
jgi:HEAT repeat protein